MRKFGKVLSGLVLASLLGAVLPGCNTLKPAPIVDRSTSVSGHSVAHGSRTYRYVVRSGDTLYAVSKLHGVTVAQIAQMNNIEPPYIIQPGQILVVDTSLMGQRQPAVAAQSPPKVSVAQASPPPRTTTRSTTPVRTAPQSTAKPQSTSTAPSSRAPTKPKSTTVASTPPKKTETIPQSSVAAQVLQTPQQDLTKLPKGWQWPVSAKPLQSNSSEDGLSYFLNRGNKVLAAASGRVSYAGVALSDYRYMILVKTADDHVIQYDFNTELTVKENDIVTKGQTLITITDSDTKSDKGGEADEELYRKLYFAIWRKGAPQDPKKLISSN